MKFQVLRKRTNVNASFPEHLICSNFEIFSVLTLGFLFQFDFLEHPVCSNFKKYSVLILFFLFWFPPIHPKCFYNSHILEILGALRKKQWYCFFRGEPCKQQFENLEWPNSSFIYFVLTRLNQNECVKVFFSGNSRWFAKGAVILLLSWRTLCIAFSKRIDSVLTLFFWFWFATTNLKCILKDICYWYFRCFTNQVTSSIEYFQNV